MGKSPNSLLISNMNKSGGSLTIERQQKKFVGEPASPTNNHKGAISKSSDSANDDDDIGGRRIYEDPQVTSLYFKWDDIEVYYNILGDWATLIINSILHNLQVNSIAWANNMVEAMMSDSDEEDFMKAEDDDYGEDNINSIQNMSPSKKVLNRITKFYDDKLE